MLAIGYILDFRIPACPAVLAFIVLSRSGTRCASSHHGGRVRPGIWRCLSTIGALNLITKFCGHCGKKCFTHASRVGNQCLVSGVSLHTAKIFNRCASSWTSPESCHLNTFDFLLLISCLLYTSPSPRDGLLSRMPSSA